MVVRSHMKVLAAILVAVLVVSCGAPPAAPTTPPPAATSQPPAQATAVPAQPTTAPAQPTTAAPAATPTTAAPAQPTTSAAVPKGGTLRIGYGAEVDNLNAFTSQ